jgi:hypothetical protein
VTLAEVFDACQEIELRHAKLYATFSLLFGKLDERVARFWEQMSAEEWQHYIVVNFSRSLCARSIGLDAPAVELPAVSIQRITRALDEYERRVENEQVTLNEAFEIAIQIEGSEADTVYIYLLSTIKKVIERTNETFLLERISQIAKDLYAHVDRLVDATKRFAKDPDLVRRAYSLKEHHAHGNSN